MDRKIQNTRCKKPDYKLIYHDMVSKKYPDKFPLCDIFFKKDSFSALDILNINRILFGSPNKNTLDFNQKHRSYDYNSILEMLDYQKKNQLNNSQLASHFKLSRNTVTKWRRMFF